MAVTAFRKIHSKCTVNEPASRAVYGAKALPFEVSRALYVAANAAMSKSPTKDASTEDEEPKPVLDPVEQAAQAELVRCVFGNPFRCAPAFDRGWRTGQVLALADEMYQSRSFDRMAALADSLQAAGCADTEILEHCRSEKKHVRG
jgi:hypothetical protein